MNYFSYRLAVAMLLASLGLGAPMRPRIMNRAGQVEVQDQHWYSIKALGEGPKRTIEVFVFGEIGTWGLSSGDFIAALKAEDDGVSPVVVYFDTIGGDCFDGIAMHNMLASLGERCTARVVGACFSAGSVAASGAHRVEMADNALWMIHNPWTWMAGDSEELRRMADMMDKATDAIVASYQHRPLTIDETELRRLITAQTYMTAEEAKMAGFVDEVLTGTQPLVNNAQRGQILNRFRDIPEKARALLNQHPPADPEPQDDPALQDDPPADPVPDPGQVVALTATLLAECRTAGLQDHAEVLVKASGLKGVTEIRAAIQHGKTLKALCDLARLPDELGGLLASGADETAAKALLYDKVAARSGQVEISNQPPLETLENKVERPALDPKAIYANRRKPAKGARK
ncbi:head maturation protease, ClpP-related [Pseudomonas solani]|uniref:head maturation protease, ClpP-related n=1 Tax=Pseudomonas solani TaxID=2731552 RepID=UPI0035BE4BB4